MSFCSRVRTSPVRFFAFVAAMAVAASNAPAQILPLKHYTYEKGLVSNDITSLCQDTRGYLWVGTGEGVSIFDGIQFHNITITEGLALNHVSHISESRRTPARMLIGTWGGGVSAWVDGQLSTLLPDSTAPAKTIVNVWEDAQGTLWCLTYAGLFVGKQGTFVRRDNMPQADRILLARDGRIWIAGKARIYLCSPGSGDVLDSIALHASSDISAIHEDRNGSLWIGTRDSMLIGITERHVFLRRKISFGIVQSITDDAQHTLWLATTSGLVRVAKERAVSAPFIRYGEANGLLSNRVDVCLVDYEDNLWFGRTGLSSLTNRHHVVFPLAAIPDTYNNCKAVLDRRGHLWIVTEQGVQEKWKDGDNQCRTRRHGLLEREGNSAPTIACDSQGRIWIDTRKRIVCYEIHPREDGSSSLKAVRVLAPGQQLSHDPRFFFIVDSKERIWISVVGVGVYRVSVSTAASRPRLFSTQTGLPSNDIRALYEDRAGNIWMGSVAEGIAVISPDGDSVRERYTMSDGLSEDLIRAIVQDRVGNMWIGTRRRGLTVGTFGSFVPLSVEQGLASAVVWALAPDSSRNVVWIGTARGVEVVDAHTLKPQRSNSLPLGKAVTALGVADGRFMWYMTNDEVGIYEYPSDTAYMTPPRIHITRLEVDARPTPIQYALEFHHHQNHLTFEFVGITFRRPEEVTYQHRLVGLEDAWHPVTGQRRVTYASLPPGEYTFEVHAFNANGIRSSAPARLSFVIIPPFWTRWWFVLLVALVVGGVITAGVRVRIRRLLELERLRTRIARDLHDEIGSNLSSIAMASDLLKGRREFGNEERRKLTEISSVALSTVKDMKDIVWLIKPGNDSLDELFLRMKDTAAALLGGCHTVLDFPKSPVGRKVNLDWRQHVYLIYKEALTNIAKHAAANEVRITARVENERLTLIIQDNGKGFDGASTAGGNGLRNMRERVELLKGDLRIGPGDRGGTTIRLTARIT